MNEHKIIDYYIPPRKQGAKRHYGVHPYFTRRPWNVVQEYIKTYTPGSRGVVLDPFGGSGVTAIEAAVLGHTGIQFDINPLATFIAKEISRSKIDLNRLKLDGLLVLSKSRSRYRDKGFEECLKECWYPKKIKMPKNSDVDDFSDLFTRSQLSKLAVLYEEINKKRNIPIKKQLLLVFSSTLAKTNRTFVSAKNRAPSRGGSTILSLYRYHVPKKPVILCPFDEFESKLKKIMNSKMEMMELLNKSMGKTKIYTGSATDLTRLDNCSIDYIFTDPPYGDYINYLELSTMWNAWLGNTVSKKNLRSDVFLQKDREHDYFDLLNQSFCECFRVLKPGSFLSVVFCHRDLYVWNKLFEIFNSIGFQYIQSVPQPLNTVWSIHKKKNKLSSIAGELIITFRKPGKAKIPEKKSLKHTNINSIINSLFEVKDKISTDELILKVIPSMYESDLLKNHSKKGMLIWDEIEKYLDYCDETEKWGAKKSFN